MLTHIYSLFCASLNAFTTLCSFPQSSRPTLTDANVCSEAMNLKFSNCGGLPVIPFGQQLSGRLPNSPVHFSSLQEINATNAA